MERQQPHVPPPPAVMHPSHQQQSQSPEQNHEEDQTQVLIRQHALHQQYHQALQRQQGGQEHQTVTPPYHLSQQQLHALASQPYSRPLTAIDPRLLAIANPLNPLYSPQGYPPPYPPANRISASFNPLNQPPQPNYVANFQQLPSGGGNSLPTQQPRFIPSPSLLQQLSLEYATQTILQPGPQNNQFIPTSSGSWQRQLPPHHAPGRRSLVSPEAEEASEGEEGTPGNSRRRAPKRKRQVRAETSSGDEEYRPSGARSSRAKGRRPPQPRRVTRGGSQAPATPADSASPSSSAVPRPESRAQSKPESAALRQSGEPEDELRKQQIAHSTKGLDLNSPIANTTPEFDFVRPDEHQSSIHVIPCLRVAETCWFIKSWMRQQFGHDNVPGVSPGILRFEDQEWDKIDKSKQAWLIFLSEAATRANDRDGGAAGDRAYIFAVIVKGENRVRWFYTFRNPLPLLQHLAQVHAINPTAMKDISHAQKPAKHASLYVWLRENFLAANKIPHHPDYLAAEKLTDYCPSSLPVVSQEGGGNSLDDQDTDITTNTPVSSQKKKMKSTPTSSQRPAPPSTENTDRYAHLLTPPESILTSSLSLPSSHYLLLKRRFFAAFYKDLVQNKEVVLCAPSNGRARGPMDTGGQVKVRRVSAHYNWVVAEFGWQQMKARKLVNGWREMGWLEEQRFLPWLQAGGMFEEIGEEAEEDEDGDGEGDGDGDVVMDG
jgi:hypothetical protein